MKIVRNLQRLAWFGLITAQLLTLNVASAQPSTTANAEAMAEKLLAAVGGRSAWAALKNTVNDSQQYRAAEPVEVRAVITMDFTQPRFRIDTTGPGLKLSRVIDGEKNWRLTRDGKVGDVPAEVIADDMRWHAGHVYRTIHRVAKRDPLITLAVGATERLEILESGKRIAWFKLNAAGEPYAFGAHDDNVGSLSGPWKFERDGVRHPVWVSNADGSWRASINALQTNVVLTPSLFARPSP
ncbi:MAG: hypothetical protein JNN20_03545 [Betaproteobacteria bacterium]|nr:hypothetical protein [Betaproteobacteria bacterium]